MRATIIAIGSRGEVHPYVALGNGLRAAGHDVTLATCVQFVTSLNRAGSASPHLWRET
jgi:sterol 3beta-glucosyltransferase